MSDQLTPEQAQAIIDAHEIVSAVEMEGGLLRDHNPLLLDAYLILMQIAAQGGRR